MNVLVKSFDGVKFVMSDLTIENVDSLILSENDSFRANFLHLSRPLYVGSCGEVIHFDNSHLQSVLYNPTTQHLRTLPNTTPNSGSTYSNCTGFGKDSVTGDFKVIRNVVTEYFIHGDFDKCSESFEVYSFEGDSWRTIPAPDSAMLDSVGSVYVGGIYYWVACLPDGSWGVRGFEFSSETWTTMALPSNSLQDVFMLVNLEDALGCIVYQQGGSRYELRAWQSSSWEIRFRFSIENETSVERPVGFVGGRLLFVEKKVTCNPVSYQLAVLDIVTDKFKCIPIFSQSDYMQVLAYCPRGLTMPNSKRLSEYNNEAYWEEYWNTTLAAHAQYDNEYVEDEDEYIDDNEYAEDEDEYIHRPTPAQVAAAAEAAASATAPTTEAVADANKAIELNIVTDKFKCIPMFSQSDYMQVVAYYPRRLTMPNSQRLSECNNEADWEEYWNTTLPGHDYSEYQAEAEAEDEDEYVDGPTPAQVAAAAAETARAAAATTATAPTTEAVADANEVIELEHSMAKAYLSKG